MPAQLPLRRNWLNLAWAGGLVLVLGLALWFRVSSLETIPIQDGDESFEGIELAHALQGQPVKWFTVNGNLLNPFFLAFQAPFQMISWPSVAVLRAPAVVSGLLAIIVLYAFGLKVLDRPTALLAAVVLATLPSAIVYGRIGHEYCQMPLVGILAICFALKASTIGLALTIAASLLVHPLNVFLVPVVLPIYLTQLIRAHANNRAKLIRVLGWVTVSGLLGVGLVAYGLWSRPIVQATVSHREALDWSVFFRGFEVFMLHAYNPFPDRNPSPGWLLRAEPWVYWCVVAPALVFGTVGMVRRRQWERLALLGGLMLSLTAFHVIAGPGKLDQFPTNRYGVIFIAPAVMVFACLVTACLGSWPTATQARGEVAHKSAALVIGCSLLAAVYANWFAPFEKEGVETVWTMRADSQEMFARAITIISHHAKENSTVPPSEQKPCRVMGQGWWISKPLQYLTVWSKNIRVEELPSLSDEFRRPEDQKARDLEDARYVQVFESLGRGDYVVGLTGHKDAWRGMVELVANTRFSPEELEIWKIKNLLTGRSVGVFHIKQGQKVPRAIASEALPAARR